MRPVTLRIAVGPANSDDIRVVQTLAQALNNQPNSLVRLRPMQTDGPGASAQALAEGKADLAIIRGDLDAEERAAVATLRQECRGAAGAAGHQGQGQRPGQRSPLSRSWPDAVSAWWAALQRMWSGEGDLQQYGVDPGKVDTIQFPANEAGEAIRSQKADAHLAAGPINSKITTE